MKKVTKYMFAVLFLLFFVICGNTKSVYALTEEEVKSLREGDTLKVTTESKVYYYGYTASSHDVQVMQIMPGYEDTRIPVGTLLAAMKVSGNKCYRVANGIYYVSVNWGHIDCYVHFHNLAKTTISQEDEDRVEEFLNKENVKKIQNGEAEDLDDQELIDIAIEAKSIFLDTANEEVNQVQQKALLELQERGYTYSITDDGGVIIYDSEGEIAGEQEGEDMVSNVDTSIYQNPLLLGNDETSEQSLDDMMEDADSFINSGHSNYNEGALQSFSKTMYNILLAVGVAVAVIVGGFIGLKFMTVTSAEEKAEVTKLLIPYLVGCVVVFGGFTIWKIVVNILSGI